MATPVIMPRQGQSVESCILTEWLKSPGDQVVKGELLFSYETDKAAFEAESPENGILLAIFAEPGEEVPVLQNIAVIGEKGESYTSFLPKSVNENLAELSKEKKETEIAIAPAATRYTNESFTNHETRISPRARKKAATWHINYDGITGTGPSGRIIEKDIIEKSKGIPRATPLAKSIAYEDHVDMPGTGSGIHGKVVAKDIKKGNEGIVSGSFVDEKLSNVRKIIAENMLASLQHTAQLTLHLSADARKLKSLRAKLKKETESSGRVNITINDMVCFAAIQALNKHIKLNAHFLESFIRIYNDVHLGFAVDTPRGLMVPTIRNASHLTIDGLSLQMKALSKNAIEGKIDPELLKGASFTVTNLGAYGIEMFTPVLNPPQVAILGVNTITLQPTELDDGGFGFVPKIGLSLTFDHRAIDGAPAADFLRTVKNEIENIDIR